MKTNDQPLLEIEDLRGRLKELGETLSDLQNREEMSRKSEQEKTAILNSVHEAITYLDVDMKVLWTNKTASEPAGLTPEQIIGRHCYEVWCRSGEPRIDCPAVRTIKTGQTEKGEISTPDGKTWLHHSYPAHDARGNIMKIVITTLDITERKRAEELLKRSENAYRTLAENLPGMVYRVFIRENNRMEFFNKMLEPMTDYTAEELTAGKVCSIEPFIVLEDQEAVVRMVQHAILNRQPFEVEYRLRTKSGEIRYFHERGRPIYGEDGGPLYIDGVIIDITERRHMEEELRRSHDELEIRVGRRTAELFKVNQDLQKKTELLERLFSSTDVLIAYMDKNFNFLRVNHALAEDDGRDPGFFVGKNLFDLFPDVDKEDLRKVVEMGEAVSGYESPFVHPEHPGRGVTYWDWSLQPVREPDGRVVGLVLSFVNVTNRKLAEKAAKDEQAFRKAIEDSILVGITAVDLEGRKIYVNPAFCRMVGWSAEELTGAKPPFLFWPPEERDTLTEAFGRLMSGGEQPQTFQQRFQRRNGERFDAVILNSPLKDHQGQLIGWVGSIGDITERKKAEEALRESEKRLRLLSSQLISVQEQERKRTASELHDGLAALLNGIKYKVEVALQQRGKNKHRAVKEQLESIIPMIQESVEEVRRIQTGLRPVTLDTLGVLSTIRSLCRKFQTTYPSISIQQQIDIEEGEIPASLKIVIYRISQEALNNVGNHSKADLMHLSLQKREGKIELVVEDNGLGFDVNEALSMKSSERGLGLISMRERAELSGGSFVIESILGKGTTIRASWPCPLTLPLSLPGGCVVIES